MKYIKVNERFQIPSLAFGTYRTSGDSLTRAIKEAIKCGYRHFDCAWFYGNEKTVGEALKEAIQESNGSLKREDLFIVSKLWCTFHSKDMVRKGLAESLYNFQMDYLDLYLIHWPMAFKEGSGEALPQNSKAELLYSDVSYVETYKAMEELMREGKVKNIGVSNFNIKQLQDIFDNCEIKPFTNQIEVQPYFHNSKLVDFCQNNKVLVSAYAPLGGGEKSKIPGVSDLLENQILNTIGKKYKKTTAQVCLRWGIQKGFAVLAKSVTPSRIVENYQIFDFELTEEDMNEIKKLDYNMRLVDFANWFKELKDNKFYPFDD
jgi:diketogulonate reductase-like aldo/keto reductase